jgi:hypothetical protein
MNLVTRPVVSETPDVQDYVERGASCISPSARSERKLVTMVSQGHGSVYMCMLEISKYSSVKGVATP